jgi:hypothetical protein
VPAGESLRLELHARRREEDRAMRLAGLAFVPGHPRYWGDLPSDEELYADASAGDEPPVRAALRREVSNPRFPLAGDGERSVLDFPLSLPLVAEDGPFLGPPKPSRTALERDGLAEFDAGLFVDEDLAGVGTEALLAQADFLRYGGASRRRLRGIHAALDVSEATIIAVPDAVQPGWIPAPVALVPPPHEPAPFPRPERWRYLPCDGSSPIPLHGRPDPSQFVDCELEIVEAPYLERIKPPDATGTFRIFWARRPNASYESATYVLEECARPDWAGAVEVYRGAEPRAVIYGRAPGVLYYRVRALVGGVSSDWSDGEGVRVQAKGPWRALPGERYDGHPDALLEVQASVLRLCAARGDLQCVLALPSHFREDAAARHAERLRVRLGAPEGRALSFGALYHPWLVSREGGGDSPAHREAPPDGAVCGVMARRALERGAWTAPANEPLAGVAALTPAIGRQYHLDLQAAQVNLVRQEPRGFLCLSEDTLSPDPDLRPVNVRRLLILLRRLALKRGAEYVFEPNDDVFRRSVERGFGRLLDDLYRRGALTGSSPREAYRVVVADGSLNTAWGVEQGRLLVELKVAPSRPLTFLTVRLVQTPNQGLSAMEV